MIILQASHVEKAFQGEVLFSNIDLTLQENSRVGLVGRNGAGKSTLLKLLTGEELPTAGEIIRKKEVTLGYLTQDTGLSSERTIFAEMLTVFIALIEKEKRLTQLEKEFAQARGDELSNLMETYDRLAESFKQESGYDYQTKIESVLTALKFPVQMWEQKISDLSGGQKTRLALAKVLLAAPKLLILDEPTNHLDIETIDWLENYLRAYAGGLLVVSHDRYFLDKVTTETFELSRGKLSRFAGNYSFYATERLKRLESQQKAYQAQQKEIEKLEDFIDRNLVRASTTKRAQSRRKQLEKIERLDVPDHDQKGPHLVFETQKNSGNVVLTVNEAAIGYGSLPLSAPIQIDERKGQALALVGENGIGKTTLLKSIIGEIPLLSGTVKLGANVSLGYYDQEQGSLDLKKTVLNELWDRHKLMPEAEIRSVLGAFLFTADAVKKTVGMLSGGEKARLLLAELALAHDNFLVLDEPTNHLDIDSREVLEAALINFDGTLLFVSHDRYFINRIASQVVELSPSGSQTYLGDYDYYLEKKAQEKEKLQEAAAPAHKEKTADSREAQKSKQRENRKKERALLAIEERLEIISSNLTELEGQMQAQVEDYEALMALQEEVQKLQQEKEGLEEEWLLLSEEMS